MGRVDNVYRGFLGGWLLEGASVHCLYLHRAIWGWTKIKSAKFHILEFTMMWISRPLATTCSFTIFQIITPGEGLQVRKRTGSFAFRLLSGPGWYFSIHIHTGRDKSSSETGEVCDLGMNTSCRWQPETGGAAVSCWFLSKDVIGKS